MAEENTDTATATETDIFQQQKKTIELLQDAIAKRQQQGAQTVYVQQQKPPAGKPNNYLMYAGIGLLFLVLTGKIKLWRLN